MLAPPLSWNDALGRSSRLGGLMGVRDISPIRDLTVLVVSGIVAAVCVHTLDFNLRIPGHAILRSILPMTLGMSLAPRRMAGTVVGGSALATSVLLRGYGYSVGWGAFGSLLAIGPMLDLALWQVRSGRGIVLRCALAGFSANAIAFGVRGGKKAVGLDSLTMRPLADWMSTAVITYTLCGLVAGLLAGFLWFRWSAPARPVDSETSA